MSNPSVLDRLEAELTAYERGDRDSAEFGATLRAGIEALEGVAHAKLQEARRLEHDLEVAGFQEEEDLAVDRAPLIRQLRAWLRELRRQIESPERR